jgi:hypothetical protein
MALSYAWPTGRARQLCPGTSDINFLGNFNCIVDLNAQVPDCALNLRVSEQKLDSTQIAGSAVDQGRLGSPERVGTELQRVKADVGDPLAYQTSILAGCQTAAGLRSPGK